MTVPEETTTPAEETAPHQEQPPGERVASAPSEEPSGEDALPEWARKELAKVRGEAANYRTRLRDAETKLGEAKSPDEFEAALSELRAQNAELERSVLRASVARKYELPDDLADALRGEDEAALAAHAKVLAKYIPAPAPQSLGGGLTPDDGEDGEMDPRKLARLSRRF
ncbi:hypothetical protein LKL35_26225 [Streptomyces sp. ET3-23]|uniref:hypothetical protein n=1 Tax=Streptomyces sp. ET3-23 TaxID=2885643 RepID=UPI001D0F80B6|nr:hypothetical protein [Streptomyces sp. ET3-23]MCC2278897.1 hypothetical protein [Streptomyces sp. ET3-23]